MDLASLKKKALELKDKTVEFSKKTYEDTAKKVAESKLVLKNQDDLLDFIVKSQNSTYEAENGQLKVFTKRTYLIVWDSQNEFFKEILISLPVLITKAFSQNVSFKLADKNNTLIDFSNYNLVEFPTMLVFENKELYKIVVWEENLKKVVKSLTLDINKTVDEL